MRLEIATMTTPLGSAHIACAEGALVALAMGSEWTRVARLLDARFPDAPRSTVRDPGGVVTAVRAYFDGDLRAFDALAISPGGTPFQVAVWRALRRVRAGTTTSYADLARRAGQPRAIRAVGSAMGANPIWIAQPCHRVLRSDGSLGGYAGGLRRKRWLLAHEQTHAVA